jgi:hypothetical protein
VYEDFTRAEAIVRSMGDDAALGPTDYFEHYAHHSGEIKKPVSTLSNVIGEAIAVAHELT